MIGRFLSPAERAHSAVAWAALVSGAMSPDPLPDDENDPAETPCLICGVPFHDCRCYCDPPESSSGQETCFTCGEHECRCPVDCPECEGTGVVPHPRGHEVACGRCWGDRTIPREDRL